MKRIAQYISIAFVALITFGCNDLKESAESLTFPEKEITLTATRETIDSGTRSFRLDDGSVWWSPNEEVSVFYGSGTGGGSKFVSMNTSIAETVELQGSIQMTGSGKAFWAVYPYLQDNSCDGSSITTVIPSSQTGVEGNFSDDAFPAMAKGSSTSLPFWNICGGIKFFVSRTDIKSVTIKGNNNEILAGKVKVSFNQDGKPEVVEVVDGKTEVTLNAPDGGTFKVGKYYYITLLPAKLSSGFTMVFETGDTRGTVVSEKAQEVKRSTFGVLKNIDAKVSEWKSTVVEPKWVDLGLPSGVKWATYNVGATKPEDYGDYFAWGETEPKSNYSWSTYIFELGTDENGPFSKYVTTSSFGTVDNKTVLDPEDDAAHVNWGGSWRMPTDEDWTELLENCTCTWTSDYNGTGVAGSIVTSNKTGYTDKSIFLPATGVRYNRHLGNVGSACCYWSSSIDTEGYSSYSMAFAFSSKGTYRFRGDRFYGRPVRPVYGEFIPVSSISMNDSSLNLVIGSSAQLVATITPSNATEPSVRWVAADESIATADDNGLVTAISAGATTITAYASNGMSASCEVTVNQDAVEYEWVDLGLSVKWATMNVGATKPDEFGDFFAWGETEPKSEYSWATYKWCNGSESSLTKYTKNYFESGDNLTMLDLADDAAHVNWGGSWRMPTDAEWTELLDNCTCKRALYNGGISGLLVTSNKSGYTDKSIFLPAAGYQYDKGKMDSCGHYWSSSLNTVGSSANGA